MVATLKELPRFAITEPRRNSFRVGSSMDACSQGCKAQPWAEISERFQRFGHPVLKLRIELAISNLPWLISPLQPNAAHRSSQYLGIDRYLRLIDSSLLSWCTPDLFN